MVVLGNADDPTTDRALEQALLRMDDWLAGWLSGAGTLIKADNPQVQLIHNQADDDFK